MSTRWYPLYQVGNPQLRVFLPNFWLKLVQPTHKQPKNVVQFHCSMEMTKYDVKNYLEKIYDLHPLFVNTRIALGKIERARAARYVTKEDDIKIAYVVFDKSTHFEFPDLFPKKGGKSEEDRVEEFKEEFAKFTGANEVPGFPSWFRSS